MRLFRVCRPGSPRRGVTLVEMLVAVALLVLLMTVIVQVFAAATTAVSAAKTYQDLDGSLRQLDSTIRQDLANVTARFTPPLNPKDGLGYFEYGENSFADSQGEDTDDYIRFTVKAPEGQAFQGRFWPSGLIINPATNPSPAMYQNYFDSHPITITSEFAEVIYFLRNGNLYRRVLLVTPERQSAITLPGNSVGGFSPGIFNQGAVYSSGALINASWQGVNDVSAHPSAVNSPNNSQIILNSLGDLTNRENRVFYPRFGNDFTGSNGVPDGLTDDDNVDGLPDFYPSLYYGCPYVNLPAPNMSPPPFQTFGSKETLAFPYVYPGAYSVPDLYSLNHGLGWIYSPDPKDFSSLGWLAWQSRLNHSPQLTGDNLPFPSTLSTWWGFPTWRETFNLAWGDPATTLTTNGQQAQGLHYFNPSVIPASNSANFMPPIPNTLTLIPTTTTLLRATTLANSDNAGSLNFAAITPPANSNLGVDALWRQLWEDDLILTGVRSFDVKAYDDAYPGFVDLGWADDGRLWAPYAPYLPANALSNWTPPLLGFTGGTAGPSGTNVSTATALCLSGGLFNWPPSPTSPPTTPTSQFDLYNGTLAHEGRMPPLVWDQRLDYQTPTDLFGTTNFYLGDDNTNVVRLRRVWDTWSTDYSYAPTSAVVPQSVTTLQVPPGAPFGPPFQDIRPVYPSYPPPYPAPLRGIQIQVRVVDPRNERTKVLTIRQDFSDKL